MDLFFKLGENRWVTFVLLLSAWPNFAFADGAYACPGHTTFGGADYKLISDSRAQCLKNAEAINGSTKKSDSWAGQLQKVGQTLPSNTGSTSDQKAQLDSVKSNLQTAISSMKSTLEEANQEIKSVGEDGKSSGEWKNKLIQDRSVQDGKLRDWQTKLKNAQFSVDALTQSLSADSSLTAGPLDGMLLSRSKSTVADLTPKIQGQQKVLDAYPGAIKDQDHNLVQSNELLKKMKAQVASLQGSLNSSQAQLDQLNGVKLGSTNGPDGKTDATKGSDVSGTADGKTPAATSGDASKSADGKPATGDGDLLADKSVKSSVDAGPLQDGEKQGSNSAVKAALSSSLDGGEAAADQEMAATNDASQKQQDAVKADGGTSGVADKTKGLVDSYHDQETQLATGNFDQGSLPADKKANLNQMQKIYDQAMQDPATASEFTRLGIKDPSTLKPIADQSTATFTSDYGSGMTVETGAATKNTFQAVTSNDAYKAVEDPNYKSAVDSANTDLLKGYDDKVGLVAIAKSNYQKADSGMFIPDGASAEFAFPTDQKQDALGNLVHQAPTGAGQVLAAGTDDQRSTVLSGVNTANQQEFGKNVFVGAVGMVPGGSVLGLADASGTYNKSLIDAGVAGYGSNSVAAVQQKADDLSSAKINVGVDAAGLAAGPALKYGGTAFSAGADALSASTREVSVASDVGSSFSRASVDSSASASRDASYLAVDSSYHPNNLPATLSDSSRVTPTVVSDTPRYVAPTLPAVVDDTPRVALPAITDSSRSAPAFTTDAAHSIAPVVADTGSDTYRAADGGIEATVRDFRSAPVATPVESYSAPAAATFAETPRYTTASTSAAGSYAYDTSGVVRAAADDSASSAGRTVQNTASYAMPAAPSYSTPRAASYTPRSFSAPVTQVAETDSIASRAVSAAVVNDVAPAAAAKSAVVDSGRSSLGNVVAKDSSSSAASATAKVAGDSRDVSANAAKEFVYKDSGSAAPVSYRQASDARSFSAPASSADSFAASADARASSGSGRSLASEAAQDSGDAAAGATKVAEAKAESYVYKDAGEGLAPVSHDTPSALRSELASREADRAEAAAGKADSQVAHLSEDASKPPANLAKDSERAPATSADRLPKDGPALSAASSLGKEASAAAPEEKSMLTRVKDFFTGKDSSLTDAGREKAAQLRDRYTPKELDPNRPAALQKEIDAQRAVVARKALTTNLSMDAWKMAKNSDLLAENVLKQSKALAEANKELLAKVGLLDNEVVLREASNFAPAHYALQSSPLLDNEGKLVPGRASTGDATLQAMINKTNGERKLVIDPVYLNGRNAGGTGGPALTLKSVESRSVELSTSHATLHEVDHTMRSWQFDQALSAAERNSIDSRLTSSEKYFRGMTDDEIRSLYDEQVAGGRFSEEEYRLGMVSAMADRDSADAKVAKYLEEAGKDASGLGKTPNFLGRFAADDGKSLGLKNFGGIYDKHFSLDEIHTYSRDINQGFSMRKQAQFIEAALGTSNVPAGMKDFVSGNTGNSLLSGFQKFADFSNANLKDMRQQLVSMGKGWTNSRGDAIYLSKGNASVSATFPIYQGDEKIGSFFLTVPANEAAISSRADMIKVVDSELANRQSAVEAAAASVQRRAADPDNAMIERYTASSAKDASVPNTGAGASSTKVATPEIPAKPYPITSLDSKTQKLAVEGSDLVVRDAKTGAEITRMPVTKVEEGDSFYHWTNEQNFNRWAEQGNISESEMREISTPSTQYNQRGNGPGFYVSTDPVDSTHAGSHALTIEAQQDFYLVQHDLTPLSSADPKKAQEVFGMLKAAGVRGGEYSDTWRTLFDESALTSIRPTTTNDVLEHFAEDGAVQHSEREINRALEKLGAASPVSVASTAQTSVDNSGSQVAKLSGPAALDGEILPPDRNAGSLAPRKEAITIDGTLAGGDGTFYGPDANLASQAPRDLASPQPSDVAGTTARGAGQLASVSPGNDGPNDSPADSFAAPSTPSPSLPAKPADVPQNVTNPSASSPALVPGPVHTDLPPRPQGDSHPDTPIPPPLNVQADSKDGSSMSIGEGVAIGLGVIGLGGLAAYFYKKEQAKKAEQSAEVEEAMLRSQRQPASSNTLVSASTVTMTMSTSDTATSTSTSTATAPTSVTDTRMNTAIQP